ncbi:MAG: glutamyl-tRNA(Gln) amidotransferase subunit D [Marine Group III euryarchaeote CG-Epi2]|uniref:Glutamyl-tRNA(Gln) amidotransferase subunit D n=1 Tax=Marine Group III euryarchaeote CG-Epi2 TaxID=1888996 RepID=A0A1J5TQW7_9ARCH|nr:MAG: glutamyl-tRNA(Gln) amidotransferase subunit D [Marine Group III euryarchaeote CG-Epi2]
MPTAEKFIQDNGAEVHDKVRIETETLTYEGLILPKHKFSGEHIIMIKLDNGYNIGVSMEGAKMTILSKAKQTDYSPVRKINNENLGNITILGTGGTIASFVDYKTGAVSPAITAEQLVNSVKSLDEIANINAIPLFSLASEDMNPSHWEDIAKKVKEIHDSKKHGIVIAHGTDTMAYSAAALSFQLPEIAHPIVFTGSQRSPDRPSSDAHLNLAGAAKTAMSDIGEVCIAMHETTNDKTVAIWRGNRTRKSHTSKRDAFTSPNELPLGIVSKNIEWKQKYKPTSKETILEAGFDNNIGMVWSHPGLNEEDWQKMTSGKNGIVIAGTGLGHIKSELLDIVGKTAKDIPVAMTSQCLSGTTNLNVYRNGRELSEKGVIEAYDILPETALVKMMWLSKHRPNKVRELMGENLVGEISNSRKMK